MKKFLDTYSKCPICNSKKHKKSKPGYLNRYSEEISDFLKIDEVYLNKLAANRKCLNCKLIYKEKWFKKKYLKKIFNYLIPTHPKGWDKLSKKFNKNYFLNLTSKVLYFLKKEKHDLLNRYKREMFSFLDAIDNEGDNKSLKKNIISNFKKKNGPRLKLYAKQLSKKMGKPVEFSRFQGFESKELIQHIEKKIGPIVTYSELGCPLWGNLNYLSKKNVECIFVKGSQNEFWGKNCRKNKKNCLTKLNKKIQVVQSLQNHHTKTKKDFIGLFLYLDHVLEPNKFFTKIFKNFKSCGIILEDPGEGVPIQHFSGWSKQSLQMISKKFKKKLDHSFKKLQSTGKSFYLIY